MSTSFIYQLPVTNNSEKKTWQYPLSRFLIQTNLVYHFIALKYIFFVGIVTNDKCASAGIFILDNKIIIIVSTLCVITNIKRVQNGLNVSIRNAHLMKPNSHFKSALILCAKSHLIIQQDEEDDSKNKLFSMHDKNELKHFEANPMIQECLHLKLSPKQLLKLFLYMSQIEQNINEAKKLNLKADVLLNAPLKAILDFFQVDIKNVPHRSLMNEFMSRPHMCSVEASDCSDEDWPENPFNTLQNNLEIIKENMNFICEEMCNLEIKRSPCKYKYHFVKSDQLADQVSLVGLVLIDPVKAQYVFKDNSGQIEIVFTKKNLWLNSQSVIKLVKWMAVIEFFSVGSWRWTHQYLIAQEIKLLPQKVPNSLEILESGTKWLINFYSHPMVIPGSTNQDFSVIVCAKKMSSDHSEEKFFRIPVQNLSNLNFDTRRPLLMKQNQFVEKFSPALRTCIDSGLISSRFNPTVTDVTEFEVVVRNGRNDFLDVFDVSDMDQIPIGQFVNVEGTIGKKYFHIVQCP